MNQSSNQSSTIPPQLDSTIKICAWSCMYDMDICVQVGASGAVVHLKSSKIHQFLLFSTDSGLPTHISLRWCLGRIRWFHHYFAQNLTSIFFPKDVSSQGSSEDCLRISHHTYPTHIQHITHIPHISIPNVSTTHIPHISSTSHISHTYPFQTYPTHTYPTSTYPCNAYPFKRL